MMQETRCENCGLNIEKDYILFVNGREFTFDSFECAANFVAPRCTYCNSIMAPEAEYSSKSFCCLFCSNEVTNSLIMP